MTINLVLPFPSFVPIGGIKSFYEYANRLSKKGHQINIIHSTNTIYFNYKTNNYLRYLYYKIRMANKPKWFKLNKNINSIIIPKLTDKYVPNADIIMSTWWATAIETNELSAKKGVKFNMIQDYETWIGNISLVNESFKLPARKIIVAKYLENIIKKHSNDALEYIPYGIEKSIFKITKPIKTRNNATIIMMYSEEPRKGSEIGIKALIKLKESIPTLKVTLFSVFPKSNKLPNWINYYQKPKNLAELYNEHAIFLTPSIKEGFGIPVLEAMCCGCAIVATDVDGHKDFAINNQTALSVQPCNVQEIKNALEKLIYDSKYRIDLAHRGNELSNNFDWDKSVNKLEKLFSSYL